MKNIEISQSVNTSRDDKAPSFYVRFSCNFDDESEALIFQAKLIALAIEFDRMKQNRE